MLANKILTGGHMCVCCVCVGGGAKKGEAFDIFAMYM